jgi:hypothetical protein
MKVALLGLLPLLAWGCAGSGVSVPGSTTSFAGTYGGSWSEATQGNRDAENGTWTTTITTAGAITGTATSSAYPGVAGTITGTVDNSGNVSITSTFTGQTATTITGTFVLIQATATHGTQISGTLIENVGGTNYNMALFLTPS